jgi:hypothetical protein
VSTQQGDRVAAGSPIAVLRPVFKYTLEGKVSSEDATTLDHSAVIINLRCDAGMPADSKLQSAILGQNDPKAVYSALKQMKSAYLANTSFSGIAEVVGDTNSSGDNGLYLHISFSIEKSNRTIGIPSDAFGAKLKELLTATATESSQHDSYEIRAGIVSIGERCDVKWHLPSAVNASLDLEKKWEALGAQ